MTTSPLGPTSRADLRVGQKLWHAGRRTWVVVEYTSHHVADNRVRVYPAEHRAEDFTTSVGELRWEKPT